MQLRRLVLLHPKKCGELCSCRKTILKQSGHTPRMAMRDDGSDDGVHLRQTMQWVPVEEI